MADVEQFLSWWSTEAAATGAATAAKLEEYGASDLVHIGLSMATMMGRTVGDDEAFELGCFFYLYGKVTRALSAYQRHRVPSDDTWLDLSVYAKMVLAKRAGVWPNEHTTTRTGE